MEESQANATFIALTARIVAAYLRRNTVPIADLPSLVAMTHKALEKAGAPEAVEVAEAASSPAVPVKKSVRPDHIVCLDCGKTFKMLKRHLQSDHALSAEEYRAKWSLPPDYPVVAPNYAAERSKLALALGLGKKREAE
jgi:predicted transcriptional regulator